MPNLTTILIFLGILYLIPGSGFILPWKDELGQMFRTLIPYAPLLAALVILRPILATATAGAGGVVGGLGAAIRKFSWVVIGIPVVALILLADTALLGPLGQWMWKYQFGFLLLIILSAVGLGMTGGITQGVIVKLLTLAIVASAASIGWSYFGQDLTNTKKLHFSIKNGVVFVDPVGSIRVGAGDEIEVEVHGKSCSAPEKVAGKEKTVRKCYPPFGSFEETAEYEKAKRARGQLLLTVTSTHGGEVTQIPLEITQSGPRAYGLVDSSTLTGGYWMKAEARIPSKVGGRLGIAFVGFKPDWGKFDVTLKVNSTASTVGKVLGLGWFTSLLAVMAIIALLYGAIALVKYFFGGLPAGVSFLGFLLLVALIGALFQTGAISLPPAPKGLLDRLERMLTPRPSTATVYTPPAPTGPMVIGPGQTKVLTPEEEAVVNVPRGAVEAKVVAPVGGVWLRGGSGCVRAAGRERCWDIAVLEKDFGGQQKCYPSDITVLPGSRFSLKGGSSGAWRCHESS